MSSKPWYLCEGRIREFALLLGEENNNDSGHNRSNAATALCALMWAGGWIFQMATKHTHTHEANDFYSRQRADEWEIVDKAE